MGNLSRDGAINGTFGGLAETTGRDRTEIQRAAARDDGSLADLIGESAAKKATRERLAALNSGHMMGSDVQAKLLARKEAWFRERQLEARAEPATGPTLLGSRALRELELNREVYDPDLLDDDGRCCDACSVESVRAAVKYPRHVRAALAAKGHAMEDGSYPIVDDRDLQAAIKAVGRGGADHNMIRKYIIKRARQMGRTSLIPPSWSSTGSLGGTS